MPCTLRTTVGILSLTSVSAACTDDLGPRPVAIDLEVLPDLRLVETSRIGSRNDPDVGFSLIGGVQVAPDGSVVVVERQTAEIRVYSPDGELIRTLGRRGEGPGEFRDPLFLGLRGDTVWISDPLQRRLTLFDIEGTVLQTVPAAGATMEVRGRRIPVIPTHPLGGGRFGGASFVVGPAGSARDSVTVPAPAFDSTGAVVDTVGYHFIRPSREGFLVQNARLSLPTLPADWPLRFAVGTDTVEVMRPSPTSSEPASLTVVRRATSGDTLYRARLRYTPRPFEDDHLLAATLWLNRFWSGVDSSAIADALQEQSLETPAFHSPVTGHLVGPDGTVWLQREEVGDPDIRWLVIAPDGTPRGHLRIPRNQTPQWVSAEAVWLEESDDFDVPWLVRMRVEG